MCFVFFFVARTYVIVGSKIVRPGTLYRVIVTLLEDKDPLAVRASLIRDGVELASASASTVGGQTQTLAMQVRRGTYPIGNFCLINYFSFSSGLLYRNYWIYR